MPQALTHVLRNPPHRGLILHPPLLKYGVHNNVVARDPIRAAKALRLRLRLPLRLQDQQGLAPHQSQMYSLLRNPTLDRRKPHKRHPLPNRHFLPVNCHPPLFHLFERLKCQTSPPTPKRRSAADQRTLRPPAPPAPLLPEQRPVAHRLRARLRRAEEVRPVVVRPEEQLQRRLRLCSIRMLRPPMCRTSTSMNSRSKTMRAKRPIKMERRRTSGNSITRCVSNARRLIPIGNTA